MADTVDSNTFWIVVGALGTGISSNFIIWWTHTRACKQVGEAIVRLDQTLKDLKELLGPEVARLREHAHENKGAILALSGRISVLEERTK